MREARAHLLRILVELLLVGALFELSGGLTVEYIRDCRIRYAVKE